MMYPIDKGLFNQLEKLDPVQVCRRAGCRFDEAKGALELSAWSDVYKVFPHRREIECLRGEGPGPHSYFSVFLIHYLISTPGTDPVGEWISEKDIPGGSTFFRGPHQIPTGMISGRYGNDIQAFGEECQRLGGIPLSLADAAFSFHVAPRTPVAVLYWQGDDDFGPEAKVLFDRSLASYLAADAVFALAVDVCARISKKSNR
jgi:hypothetical protein